MALHVPSFSKVLVIIVLLPLLINTAPAPVKKNTEGTTDDLLHSVLEYLRELSKLKHGPDAISYDLDGKEENVVSPDTGLDGLGEGGETEVETVTEKSVNPRWNFDPFPTSGGLPDYRKRENLDLKHQLLEQTKTLGHQVEKMIETLKRIIQ